MQHLQYQEPYRDSLHVALRIAVEAHGAKINKDGTPYILHPLRLMLRANGYLEQIVAVLHDTVEDTYITLEYLESAGFSDEIVEAVDALTKRDEEKDGDGGYHAFIERVAQNPLATRVKLLDLYDNIDVTRLPTLGEWELKRTAKYHAAIRLLKQAVVEHCSGR